MLPADWGCMRNWRRHAITAFILLVLTLLLGPLGLGDWLWSQPRHLSTNMMIGQNQAGSEPFDEQLLALNEEALLLKKQVADLQARLLAMRQAKDFEEAGMMDLVAYDARVIRRTRGRREQYVEINRGALHKVTRGMAVCAGRSIIGLVSGEQRTESLVRLISDPQSRIAAHVYNGKNRIAGGVLAGAERSGLCELLYIEDRPGLLIKPDYYVVTAGTDGIIPEGLILGRIIEADPSKTSDSWRIIVEPLRPVHAVTEVMVCRRPQSQLPSASKAEPSSAKQAPE